MSTQDDPNPTPTPREEHIMKITDGPDRPEQDGATSPDETPDATQTTPLPAVETVETAPLPDADPKAAPLATADEPGGEAGLTRDVAATQRLDVLAGLGDAGRIQDDPEPPPTWSAATAPAAETPASAGQGTPAGSTTAVVPDEAPRGVRVGTVVWGLVIAAIGVGLIAWASGVLFDVELAVIVLVGAAGVALLLGSLLSPRRRHS